MESNHERIAVIKKIVMELSKVFRNVKDDNETVVIWGKQLKPYSSEAIIKAKERLISSHSGDIYPRTFKEMLKGMSKKTIEHEKTINPHPDVKERLAALIQRVTR